MPNTTARQTAQDVHADRALRELQLSAGLRRPATVSYSPRPRPRSSRRHRPQSWRWRPSSWPRYWPIPRWLERWSRWRRRPPLRAARHHFGARFLSCVFCCHYICAVHTLFLRYRSLLTIRIWSLLPLLQNPRRGVLFRTPQLNYRTLPANFKKPAQPILMGTRPQWRASVDDGVKFASAAGKWSRYLNLLRPEWFIVRR